MTWRAQLNLPDHVPAGVWLASLYPGLGATGAQILAASGAGEHGPGPLVNDSLDLSAEYWWWVVTPPVGATVVLTAEGQALLTAAADGSYPWTYKLKENGVLVAGPNPDGSTTVTTLVGVAAPTTINAGVGAGIGQGHAATVVRHHQVNAGVGAGTGQGHPAAVVRHHQVNAGVGQGVGQGHPASINGQLRTTINAGVGQGIGQGHPATVQAVRPTTINAGVGQGIGQGHAATVRVGGAAPTIATRHVPYAPVRSHVPWRYMAQPGLTP